MLPVCSAVSVTSEPVTGTPAPVWFSLPLQINDTGPGACGLHGYPRVRRLIGAKGGSLIPRVTRIPAGHPVTPPVVLLDPSWPAPTSINWAAPACKALPFNRVQLRLPGVRTRFTVRLRQPIFLCGKRVTVAPI